MADKRVTRGLKTQPEAERTILIRRLYLDLIGLPPTREQLNDPTAHAEMIAITQAAEAIGDWRLENCTLYVTLEPCLMCAGAILQARIGRLVYGASDPRAGAVESLFQTMKDNRLNHQVETTAGILAEACGEILTRFFQGQRSQGKK